MDFDLLKYTLSDLLIKYKYDKNDIYLNEVKRRLKYCGFSTSVIECLIKEETKLINNDSESLIKNIYITNDFKLNDIKGKEDKLLLSELLCIIDEAVMIKKYFVKDYNKDLLDELEPIKEEDLSNIFYLEFFNRIENYFRKGNNLKLAFKGFAYEE